MQQSTLHVAALMNGSAEWAGRRGLPRLEGYRAGAETLRRIVEAAPAFRISVFTAYLFPRGVPDHAHSAYADVMELLACCLDDETPQLIAGGVRLSAVGCVNCLPGPVSSAINFAEEFTGSCTRLHLRLAIGRIPSPRDEEVRPVDLLIGTGGQEPGPLTPPECAAAEVAITKCLWPEFDQNCLRMVVDDFRGARAAASHRIGSSRPHASNFT